MHNTPVRDEHDGEFVADCHVRDAAELLAHRWDASVVMALRSGDLRRRDLRERIGGISDKSLTASLTRLVSAGLVHRTTHAEAPPRVQYMLTDRGISFMDGPLVALGAWTLGSASTAQSGSHAVDQP